LFDVESEGGNGARKVNQRTNTLSKHIVIGDTGSEIGVETRNHSLVIDPVVRGGGYRDRSDLSIVNDNATHAPANVGIVIVANDIAF
jgi:hypothetical protein